MNTIQATTGEANFAHFNAIDRNGKRYTTHHFAKSGQWWDGATILTPQIIRQLDNNGLLPLMEVK